MSRAIVIKFYRQHAGRSGLGYFGFMVTIPGSDTEAYEYTSDHARRQAADRLARMYQAAGHAVEVRP